MTKKMTTEEQIEKQISEIENNITEIKRELEDPSVHNRPGKFQSIEYAKEMILDFKKILEDMKDEKK